MWIVEILSVSVFQVCEAPIVIRSPKLQCFDQLIAFTSFLPHMVKEGKNMMVRHKHGVSFLSQSLVLAKKVYCLSKFLRRELEFLQMASCSWNACP